MNQFDIAKVIESAGTKAWELAIRSVIVESWIEIGFSGLAVLVAIVGLVVGLRAHEDDDSKRTAGLVITAIAGVGACILIGDGVYGLYLPELVAINKILHR